MPSETPELLAFLLDKYQEQQLGNAGEEPQPSELDALYALLEDREQQEAGRTAILHFLDFARQFLLRHPPETQIMLAQGFGVRLSGGYDVCLTPPVFEDLAGTLEPSQAFHVTEGRSIRGQGGVQPSANQAITGPAAPTLRGPAA